MTAQQNLLFLVRMIRKIQPLYRLQKKNCFTRMSNQQLQQVSKAETSPLLPFIVITAGIFMNLQLAEA
jgi:hypothetical protein